MKKILIILTGIVMLSSCSNLKKNTNEPKPIGGEKDNHGCLSAAGQTWSELQQSCIQVFNVALRLNPVSTKENEAVISAFVLLNNDHTKAELFLPEGKKSSVILKKIKDNIYQENKYKYNTSEKTLYINGVKQYTAEK